MTRRLLPLLSKVRNLPARLPAALRPLAGLSLGRKLLLAALLTLAVAGSAWWWTGTWQAAVYTVALGTAVLLALLAIDLLARRLSRTHARAWEIEESKAVSIGEQRESWVAQVRQLARMGIDPSGIPIHILIGESGGGKTSSLKGAELNYSFGRDPVVGDGGTRNCLLYFTNEAWIIDTAGRYVISGEEGQDREVDEAEWLAFLGRLRRFRPRAPINGVVIAIPATALLDDSPEVTRRKAMLLRKALNELRVQLEMTFAVSVMVTKADRIGGFAEYFGGVQDWRERRQLLGWSPRGDVIAFDAGAYRDAFHSMVAAFRRRRLGVIEAAGPEAAKDALRRIHSFPEEFAGIAEPLESYLTTMLSTDRYFGALQFRGFFLTSSLQEGAPAFRACEELLGRPVEDFGFTGKRERSLFIHDFYAAKVFPESGFVQPTSRRKRRVVLVNRIGLAAAIAVLLGGGAYAVRSHLRLREEAYGTPASRDLAGNLEEIVRKARALNAATAVGDPGQPPTPEQVQTLVTLGKAIDDIENQRLVTLGGLDLLSVAKRKELLEELKRLHRDRALALVLGSMASDLVKAANGNGALGKADTRPKFLEALEVVVAANYGNVPPSADAVAVAVGLAGHPAAKPLAAEYRRTLAWNGTSDAIVPPMRAAVGSLAVQAISEGVTDWHPTETGCTVHDDGAKALDRVYFRVLAVERAWKDLATDAWTDRVPADRDAQVKTFKSAMEDLRDSLGIVVGTPRDLAAKLAAELDFANRLRTAAGSTEDRPVRPVETLVDDFELSLGSAFPGLGKSQSPTPKSSWQDLLGAWVTLAESGKAALSTDATARAAAIEALLTLERQEKFLASESGEVATDGVATLLKTVQESGATQPELEALETFLNDRVDAAKKAAPDTVAEAYRKRILTALVPRLGKAAQGALAAPEGGPQGKSGVLPAWRSYDPVGRVGRVAIPLAKAIGGWKSTLGDDARVPATLRELDTAVASLIERFLTDAHRCLEIPTDPLDWTRWLGDSAANPTTSAVAAALKGLVGDYDAIFGTDAGSLAESCKDAGLHDAANWIDKLATRRGADPAFAARIGTLVTLAAEIRDARSNSSRDPLAWVSIWTDRKAELTGLRPLAGDPTIESPRSIVEERIRELARAFEAKLREELGKQAGNALFELGDMPGFLCGGSNPPAPAANVFHDWFKRFDEFESNFGQWLPAAEKLAGLEADGSPLASVPDEVRTWLVRAREWRTFLYGDGEPGAFAERTATLTLDETPWPWTNAAYLNVACGSHNLRFNARSRTQRLANALNCPEVKVSASNKPADTAGKAEVAREGGLALLGWLRNDDGKLDVRYASQTLPVRLTFDGTALPPEVPGRLPNSNGTAVAGGVR